MLEVHITLKVLTINHAPLFLLGQFKRLIETLEFIEPQNDSNRISKDCLCFLTLHIHLLGVDPECPQEISDISGIPGIKMYVDLHQLNYIPSYSNCM